MITPSREEAPERVEVGKGRKAFACEFCGGVVTRSQSCVDRYSRNFCSKRCSGAARTARARAAQEQLSPEFRARFWSLVQKGYASECWEWQGSVGRNGYASLAMAGRRAVSVHRVAVLIDGRALPAGMQVDHLCKNRRCVNPAHLEVVTPAVNNARSGSPAALNMAKTHCKRGHPFSGNNLTVLRSGERRCKECGRQAMRQRYAAHKAASVTPACQGGGPYA